MAELEQRLETIDAQLKQLSHYSLRSGVGSVGYRTDTYPTETHPEWFQVNWAQNEPIDEIVLVPLIRRDSPTGFRAEGFPRQFRIIAGTLNDTNGTVIASFDTRDRIQPRIAPFIVPCTVTTASWVRIEADILSSRSSDNRYIFQLAEIMVFNGQKNAALQGTVTVSSSRRGARAWKPGCLVDGFMPYLMETAHGKKSLGVLSKRGSGNPATLTIDLEKIQPVSQIYLHPIGQSDEIPLMYEDDYAIPRHLRIEGAVQPDFSDATLLLDYKVTDICDTGPIIMRNIPEKSCRFVRLTVLSPYSPPDEAASRTRFGLAEIEIFAQGENVALGKPVAANFELDGPLRSLSMLTDGRNLYGQILPIRTWLNELALRHDLETERPLIAAELTRRYTQQKVYLFRLSWLAALLGAGTVLILFIDRFIRLRAVYRTRERIAADIHDELGANLQAIGLLGNLARIHAHLPEEQNKILERLQDLSKRTGLAARHCTNTLEAKELYEDIVEDMRRTTQRIIADLEHEIFFEGEDLLRRLKPQKRIDLFLFYKECLINIIRHSGATRMVARAVMTRSRLYLTVFDNGHGIADKKVPTSLRRRARLLGARVKATFPPGGGTEIGLRLKIKNRFLIK